MDFSKFYDRKEFSNFLRNFLSDSYKEINAQIFLDKVSNRYITEARLIGKDEKLGLEVYEFHHEGIRDPRISLAKEAFKLMTDRAVRNALAVFVPKRTNDYYRLSLLSIDLQFEDGRVERKYSNPRRYSYLLGPVAKVHTPTRRLLREVRKVGSLQELTEAFSVEVVNKEFYKGISEHFYRLVEILKLPGTDDESLKKNFAIRLISRIIFLWFLKNKKSVQGNPVIPHELLSADTVEAYQDYYHEVLEPLFFEVLNKPVEERSERYRKDELFARIPFLNGGIFQPRSHDYYELNDLGISKYLNTLRIGNDWFKEFFSFLDTYNFTIDENTPVDIELSIDPEMLGRIFENLLAEITPETGETARKQTGSYYTPREIVDFMVTKTLCYYLADKTGMDLNTVEKLASYTEDVSLSDEEKKKVMKAILDLKALDPACGSGAFPMGLLQKCVWILEKIDPQAELWKETILESIKDSAVKKVMKEKLDQSTAQYLRKVTLIENNIYGVDIQEIAVELARLRFFLSLIVDENVDETKQNMNIKPLPNLEFKFVCADSLIDIKQEQIPIYLPVDELKKIIDDYFSASSPQEKKRLEDLYQEKRKELTDEFFKWTKSWQKEKNGLKQLEDLAMRFLKWDPFGDEPAGFFNPSWFFGLNEGFDIVIANPPYIQLQNEGGKLAKRYENQGYTTFDRFGDIYCLFYERGINLLKENGYLCYITSNKWMRAKYGEKLRQFLAGYDPKILVDLGPGVFKSATVDTCIVLVQKRKTDSHNLRAVTLTNKGKVINIDEQLNSNGVVLEKLNKNVWFIGDTTDQELKEKIEQIGRPLKEWEDKGIVKMYRGILTGLNEAFIIDSKTREKILSNCKSDEERRKTEEIIKPVLRGRDIERYCYRWAGLWLIRLEAGWTNKNRGDEEPEEYFKKTLPSLYNQFMTFINKQHKGRRRGLIDRDDQGDYWWELRYCDYYPEFDKEKVVWQRITRQPTFCLVDAGIYILDSMAFFTGDHLRYLMGVLNSKLVHAYALMTVHRYGLKGFRLANQYVEKVPIPLIDPGNKHIADQIIALVDEIIQRKQNGGCSSSGEANTTDLEKEIDLLVYELYDLNQKEIEIVEKLSS